MDRAVADLEEVDVAGNLTRLVAGGGTSVIRWRDALFIFTVRESTNSVWTALLDHVALLLEASPP